MIDNINERLTEIKKKKSHLENLNSTLEELRKQHSTKTVLRKKSKRILEEAFISYQKINNFTLTSLFYSILGKKKEKLNKNTQEYLSAKLNLERLEEELEMIKSQLDKTQVEIGKLQNVEFEYQEVLTEKEEYLLLNNNLESKELGLVLNKMRGLDLELENYKEALDLIKPVIKGLNQVHSKLDSANDLKGGLVITSIKQAKKDDAKKHFKKVQVDIDNFIKKVNTIDASIVIESIDIGELSTFTGHLFEAMKYGNVDGYGDHHFEDEYNHSTKNDKSMNDVHFFRKKIFRIKGKLLDKVSLKQNEKEKLNLERIELLH